MLDGTPIDRNWVCITLDGAAVVDWGDGKAQDMYTGDVLQFDSSKYSHLATDIDLDMLIRAGRASGYDQRYIYMKNLPDRHRKVVV